MKFCFILSLLISLSIRPVLANEKAYLQHDIEGEKQTEFPGIKIKHQAPFVMAIDLADEDEGFTKRLTLKPGTQLEISSYIVAKDLLASDQIKSLASKSNRAEIREFFNTQDPTEIKKFIMKLSEKRRVAKSEAERSKIRSLSKDDDPDSTAYFPTGKIEILPGKGGVFKGLEDTRLFIDASRVMDLEFSPDLTKVTILKSLTLLGFKNKKQQINGGDLSDSQIAKLSEFENSFLDHCFGDCYLQKNLKLGDFVTDFLNILAYDSFKVSELDPKAIGKDAIYQQVCLISMMGEVCPSPKVSESIQRLTSIYKIPSQSAKQSCKLYKKAQ